MLVTSGEFRYLRYFRFSDFKCKNTCHADALPVDCEHNIGCFILGLVEEGFQNMHHKVHRRIIIVKEQDFVHGWSSRCRA